MICAELNAAQSSVVSTAIADVPSDWITEVESWGMLVAIEESFT